MGARDTPHHTLLLWVHFLLPPTRKLGQGYIFTGVCHSVNKRGAIPACIAGGIPACLAASLHGGAWSWGGLLLGEVSAPGGLPGPGGVCSGRVPGPVGSASGVVWPSVMAF